MKLVAETGVGTVAAGVAKAHSDVVLISGYDGGPGASPLSSRCNSGLAVELGLAGNTTSAGSKRFARPHRRADRWAVETGRDVTIAALLGAEEYCFSTAPLVVMGCIMMRVAI